MQIHVIAAGTKMPAWVDSTCNDYLRRLPAELKVSLIELPLEKRSKNQAVEKTRVRETERLLNAVPNGDHVIALDEKGQSLSTLDISRQMQQWQMNSVNVSLLIGGPDGLDLSAANRPITKWSLSRMTFPHPLVRVILAEQLYRAWSFSTGHPYHRDG